MMYDAPTPLLAFIQMPDGKKILHQWVRSGPPNFHMSTERDGWWAPIPTIRHEDVSLPPWEAIEKARTVSTPPIPGTSLAPR